MTGASVDTEYFTKYLFRTGINCPTKLFYKAQRYPESKTAIPFIRHAILNKRMLKSLVRSSYPNGIFVENESVEQAARATKKLLNRRQVVLFDAIVEHEQMMARLPIVSKKGEQLTVFHVQTKTFDSQRDRLTHNNGRISQRWKKYFIEFSYQLYLLKKNCPAHTITAMLVLPEKKGEAYTDNLPFLLKPMDKEKQPAEISIANQQLVAKLDVTGLIDQVWNDSAFAEEYLPLSGYEETLYYLRDLYLHKEKEAPLVGTKCKGCEFRVEEDRVNTGTTSGFNECWSPEMSSDEPSVNHVFNLIGPGVNHWVENKVYEQRKISAEDYFDIPTIVNGKGKISHKMRQALQIHKAKGEQVPSEIIRPELTKELERWQYPLHFLDFEAGNYTVPMKRNRSPYQLVVFQYSCHTLHKNGQWTHHQWIDDLQSGYPNYEVVRQLMKIPNITEGTIVQYSNFERNALKRIRRELVKELDDVRDAGRLISWIEKVIHRHDSSHHQPPYIADISRLVKDYYYNREMGSSLSIKGVLESIMSHSEYLKKRYSKPYSSHNFDDILWWQADEKGGARNPYSILTETGESPIRRGTEAMVVYGKLISRDYKPEKVQAFRNALLKYCELDTLAMVMIYQHWKHKVS